MRLRWTKYSRRSLLEFESEDGMNTTAQLDKSLDTALNEGYGTITIRIVVLEKGMAAAPALTAVDESPIDAEPEELLPDTDKRPTSTFLEEPKRGRLCCVFLINGQRQHAWDNNSSCAI